jgi:hypothetical protein
MGQLWGNVHVIGPRLVDDLESSDRFLKIYLTLPVPEELLYTPHFPSSLFFRHQ